MPTQINFHRKIAPTGPVVDIHPYLSIRSVQQSLSHVHHRHGRVSAGYYKLHSITSTSGPIRHTVSQDGNNQGKSQSSHKMDKAKHITSNGSQLKHTLEIETEKTVENIEEQKRTEVTNQGEKSNVYETKEIKKEMKMPKFFNNSIRKKEKENGKKK